MALVALYAVGLVKSEGASGIGKALPMAAVAAGISLVAIALAAHDQRRVLRIAVPALCIGLIAYFSGGKGGADPMVRWFQDWFSMTADVAEIAVHYVRKTIHFTFYGALGLSAAWVAVGQANSRQRAMAFALAMGTIMAIADEYRQTLTPGRSGSPWDVALDLAGAATFAGIFLWRNHAAEESGPG